MKNVSCSLRKRFILNVNDNMFRHALLQPTFRSTSNPGKAFLRKLQENVTLRLFHRTAICVFSAGKYKGGVFRRKTDYGRKCAGGLNDGLQRCLRNFATFSDGNLENLVILESWSNSVDPFGELSIMGAYNVHIEPVNPNEHPEMNIAHVTIYAEKERTQELKNNHAVLESDITLEDMGRKLKIHGKPHNLQPLRCAIQLPIKFGIQVDLSGQGEAEVSGLESSEVCISTKTGSCKLDNIRAGYVRVRSEGGDISCHKTLQGSVDLHTDLSGVITADKIQGSIVKIRTDRGAIRTGSLYADHSAFWSTTGSVHLGSCHGNTTVSVYRGDISIDSLDGDFKANVKRDGNVQAYLARPGKGEITVGGGDISLQLSDSVQAEIHLKGQRVEVDKTFKDLAVDKATDDTYTVYTGSVGQSTDANKDLNSKITASSYKGSVILQCCDWFNAAMGKTSNWKT